MKKDMKTQAEHTAGDKKQDKPTSREQDFVKQPKERATNSAIRGVLRPGHTLSEQFIRYFFVGGLAAAVNTGVYAMSWRWLHSTWPRFDYQIANVLGFLAGNIVNYVLATRFVFDFHRLEDRTGEFGAYFLIGLAGLAWSALILWLQVHLLRMHRDIAKVVTVGLVFGWHFGARKVLLFSNSLGRSRNPIRSGDRRSGI